MVRGSLFQVLGSAMAKLHSPNMGCINGTMKWQAVADLRLLLAVILTSHHGDTEISDVLRRKIIKFFEWEQTQLEWYSLSGRYSWCSLSHSNRVIWSYLLPPQICFTVAFIPSSLLIVDAGDPDSRVLQILKSILKATKLLTSVFMASICNETQQFLIHGSW